MWLLSKIGNKEPPHWSTPSPPPFSPGRIVPPSKEVRKEDRDEKAVEEARAFEEDENTVWTDRSRPESGEVALDLAFFQATIRS